MLIDELHKHDKYVIFGAQVIAIGAYTAIKGLTGLAPVCFTVSGASGALRDGLYGNPAEIDGIEIRQLDDVSKDTFIVVGVTELVQKDVVPMLEGMGYTDLFVLTQHEEHLLMSAYYDSIGKFPSLSVTSDISREYDDGIKSIDIELARDSGDGNAVEEADSNYSEDEQVARELDLCIYEVLNHRDTALSQRPSVRSFEIPIQAGAALTDKRIADIPDDTGISISGKNKQYCEMTASYWVWKNTDHAWKGIEHYRRHLLVRPKLLRAMNGDVDAILPLPYICYPDELYQFRRFVSEDVKDALLRGLKDVHPDEYEDYLKILHGKYQYTYNLVCARREVFDDYCSWLFEITEYMEIHYGKEVPELVETRAFSYIAEVLTNIYFMYHQTDLKIYHAEKAIFT